MRLQDALVGARKDKKAAVLSVNLLHGGPGTHDAVSRSGQKEGKMVSCFGSLELHLIIMRLLFIIIIIIISFTMFLL